MNDKIKALVLNVQDYKENDLLLQVISEDKSFVSLVAKGAKKMTSKHHFNSLCLYEFIIDYKEGKSIFSIHGSKLLKSFYVDNNLDVLSFQNILVELCLKSKELYEKELYQNILFCIEKTNDKNMYKLGCLFISYLLKINGISPIVDKCVMCDSQKVVAISNRYGGFLCANHINNEKNIDVEHLKKFRLINKADFTKYDLLDDITFDEIDFQTIMNFYIENSDNDIKSYRLYMKCMRFQNEKTH